MRQLLTTAFAVCVLAGMTVYAQPVQLTAEIPFQFVVENRTMDPGTYVVQRAENNNMGVLLIRCYESGEAAFFTTLPADRSVEMKGNPKLFFDKYGNTAFLTGIWNGDTASTVPKSKMEREYRAANHNEQSTQVAVLLHK